jgi:hypothetical protein
MDYFNEMCTEVDATVKKYVMYSYPHTIYYYNTASNVLFYSNLKESRINLQLKSFKQYEWNNIMISTQVSESGTTTMNIYVNYSFLSPIKYTTDTDQTLLGIGICNGNCDPGSQGLVTITWGSVYYRDIKVYKSSSATIYTAQAFNNEKYSF